MITNPSLCSLGVKKLITRTCLRSLLFLSRNLTAPHNKNPLSHLSQFPSHGWQQLPKTLSFFPPQVPILQAPTQACQSLSLAHHLNPSFYRPTYPLRFWKSLLCFPHYLDSAQLRTPDCWPKRKSQSLSKLGIGQKLWILTHQLFPLFCTHLGDNLYFLHKNIFPR